MEEEQEDGECELVLLMCQPLQSLLFQETGVSPRSDHVAGGLVVLCMTMVHQLLPLRQGMLEPWTLARFARYVLRRHLLALSHGLDVDVFREVEIPHVLAGFLELVLEVLVSVLFVIYFSDFLCLLA